jgi:hypothetical protein
MEVDDLLFICPSCDCLANHTAERLEQQQVELFSH